MCWREGRSCSPSLLCSPTALGDQVGWGDAGGGLGHGAFCRLGFEEEARWRQEHDFFHDTLERDSTSPISTVMTSSASSSQQKSGAWSARNTAGEGG